MSAIRIAVTALLPLIASAAVAQTATAPKAPPPVNIPGISAAGNAVLTKQRNAPNQPLKMLIGQIRDTSAQLQLESQRPVIDIDKITALLRKRESLAAQSQSLQDDRLLAALRALPAEDRSPFLRALAAPPPAAAPSPGR